MLFPRTPCILAVAALTFSVAGAVSATTLNIDNTPVTMTSSFNPGGITGVTRSETVIVDPDDAPGASIEVPGGSFSWMSAGDYIDFAVNPDRLDENALNIFFAATGTFQTNDTITFSFDFAPELKYEAIFKDISAPIDTGVSQGFHTLDFTINGIDQVRPTSGDVELLFSRRLSPASLDSRLRAQRPFFVGAAATAKHSGRVQP